MLVCVCLNIFVKASVTNTLFFFSTDTDRELKVVQEAARENGAFDAVVCTHWAEGSAGAEELADAVVRACDRKSNFKFLYDPALSLEEKIETIAKEMYGAGSVEYAPNVRKIMEAYKSQVNKNYFQKVTWRTQVLLSTLCIYYKNVVLLQKSDFPNRTKYVDFTITRLCLPLLTS